LSGARDAHGSEFVEGGGETLFPARIDGQVVGEIPAEGAILGLVFGLH